MTCDQTQPLLEAFAGGELGWRTAWRVRRHLAGCAACAAQLAEIRQLDARARAWRDVPAPAGLGGRIAAALPSAPPALSAPPRRMRVTRRAAVGLAGTAAVAAAFFWLLPGQPGRPTIAFADVVKAMANVNVMAWTDSSTIYGENKKVVSQGVTQVWMRHNPPAYARINLPGPFQPERSQTLEDQRGLMDILPKNKYILSRDRNNIPGLVKAYASFFVAPLALLESTSSSKGEKVTLNGQSVLKFAGVRHLYGSFPNTTALPQHRVPIDLEVTLWIDPATKRVVQMAERSTTNGKPVDTGVQTQIRYDETPPPNTFDVVPPPGAKFYDQRSSQR